MKCKDKYYVFGTGKGIISKVSNDKTFWNPGQKVFAQAPAWTTNAVPRFDGTFWAPDIVFRNNQYYLYYSVSSWGSQVSAIGLATNPTLDPTDPAYRWTDRGPVIQSSNGHSYNTIDPGLAVDADGNPWMVFGSYWNGIQLIQLDPVTGLRLSASSPVYRLAYNSSIEASCIFRHGSYYYLFVNWGSCCSGVNSTYNIRVGRSTSITGPYLDRNGTDLANNGGTPFLQSNGKFAGPGHAGVLSESGLDWLSYHYYDAGAWAPWYNAHGAATLDLVPLTWTSDNWPAVSNEWSALYRFEADVQDENGQYSGRLVNGASSQPDPDYGHVLSLSGSNQYVRLPAGVANAHTFAAVVKWNGGPAWQRIFDFGVDTSRYFMLTPASDTGKLRFDIKAGGSVQSIVSASALPAGVWTHVAVTLEGTNGVIYVNGVPVASRSSITISPIDVLAQTNYLGRSKFSADPDFSGKIARFMVHSRALSQQEITAPLPSIVEPRNGSSYSPGTRVGFRGSATDFMHLPLESTNLVWTVEYCEPGRTNLILGPISGSDGGAFWTSTNASGSAGYRITLSITDKAGRKAVASSFITSSAQTAPWTSFYPFSNGALDASNRYNGVLNGGASTIVDAERGNVLQLEGTQSYAALPPAITTCVSVSGWVKWNGGSAWQRIFDFGRDTEQWFMLTPLDADGRMQCAITAARSDYVNVIQADSPLPTNQWTHFAVTLDGKQGVLFLNGRVAGLNNSLNLLPSDILALSCYLGRSHFSADPFFKGRLDSLTISSRPLLLAELLSPRIQVLEPAPEVLYSGGDLIPFSAAATDFSDTPLPASGFNWQVSFFQDGRSRPVSGSWNGTSNGALQVSRLSQLTTNSFYRLTVSAVDARGQQALATADLLPKLSSVPLNTVPPGLHLGIDSETVVTPVVFPLVAGMIRTLSAPLVQAAGNKSLDFVMWSDGSAPLHTIIVPEASASYTASYQYPELSASANAGALRLTWPAWAGSLALAKTEDLTPPVSWFPVTNAPSDLDGKLVLTIPDDGEPNAFYRLQPP